MSIREFLYIDDARLSVYVEQVAGPVRRDKVPEWNVALSITGPSANATQKTESRPHTVTEKVELLTDYLTKHHMVVDGADAFIKKCYSGQRWDWSQQSEDWPVFVMDTLLAAKIRIPPLTRSTSPSQGVAMWLSRAASLHDSESYDMWPRQLGIICLLEDYRGEDQRPFDGSRDSAYSILESMLFALRQDMDATVLGKHFLPQGDHHSLAINSRLDAWWRTPDEHMEAFAQDPYATLRSMGCTISRPRKIASLFRVRDIGPEHGDGGRTVSMFGYPIMIQAA